MNIEKLNALIDKFSHSPSVLKFLTSYKALISENQNLLPFSDGKMSLQEIIDFIETKSKEEFYSTFFAPISLGTNAHIEETLLPYSLLLKELEQDETITLSEQEKNTLAAFQYYSSIILGLTTTECMIVDGKVEEQEVFSTDYTRNSFKHLVVKLKDAGVDKINPHYLFTIHLASSIQNLTDSVGRYNDKVNDLVIQYVNYAIENEVSALNFNSSANSSLMLYRNKKPLRVHSNFAPMHCDIASVLRNVFSKSFSAISDDKFISVY